MHASLTENLVFFVFSSLWRTESKPEMSIPRVAGWCPVSPKPGVEFRYVPPVDQIRLFWPFDGLGPKYKPAGSQRIGVLTSKGTGNRLPPPGPVTKRTPAAHPLSVQAILWTLLTGRVGCAENPWTLRFLPSLRHSRSHLIPFTAPFEKKKKNPISPNNA